MDIIIGLGLLCLSALCLWVCWQGLQVQQEFAATADEVSQMRRELNQLWVRQNASPICLDSDPSVADYVKQGQDSVYHND